MSKTSSRFKQRKKRVLKIKGHGKTYHFRQEPT